MSESYESFESVPQLRYAQAAPEVWQKLDEIPRTGWVKRGVQNPETVQQHTVALRELAFSLKHELDQFSPQDAEDLINMLELHDYPEAVIGDEVILEKDPEIKKRLKAEKFERELVAMKDICSRMGELGDEAFSAWIRYEERKDYVSQFARQLDLYQCLEKSVEYQLSGEPVNATEFIDYADRDITHPVLRQRIDGLREKIVVAG